MHSDYYYYLVFLGKNTKEVITVFWLYHLKWHTISACPLLVTFTLVARLWWCLPAVWSDTFSPSWFTSILRGCAFALSRSTALHKLWIRSCLYISMDSWLHILINRIQLLFAMIHFAAKNYFVDFLVGFWALLTCPQLLWPCPWFWNNKSSKCVCYSFCPALATVLLLSWILHLSLSRWVHILGSAPLGPPPLASQSPSLQCSPFLSAELSFCTPSLSYSLKSLLLTFFVEQIWW